MKKIAVLIIIAVVMGCSSQGDSGRTRFDPNKTMAWGSVQKISVFADDAVWKYAETPLRSSLERYFYTTENETYFDVERVGFNKIEQFYKFNNQKLYQFLKLIQLLIVDQFIRRLFNGK